MLNVGTFFKHTVHKVYNFTTSAIEADNYIPLAGTFNAICHLDGTFETARATLCHELTNTMY